MSEQLRELARLLPRVDGRAGKPEPPLVNVGVLADSGRQRVVVVVSERRVRQVLENMKLEYILNLFFVKEYNLY
jgi:hypothetical protein